MNCITWLSRFGCDVRWFVPLGLQGWMEEVGCKNVVELDWWEENCIPDHVNVSFVFTPAQHWSKRTLTDDNKVRLIRSMNLCPSPKHIIAYFFVAELMGQLDRDWSESQVLLCRRHRLLSGVQADRTAVRPFRSCRSSHRIVRTEVGLMVFLSLSLDVRRP